MSPKAEIAEAAQTVVNALNNAQEQSKRDLFDELEPGMFYSPAGNTCEIAFTGDTSRPGSRAEIYDYVAAEVGKEYKKPVTVGVRKVNDGGECILEFSKGKKYWRYDSDEPQPKFVRKTLACLGISNL